MGLDERADPDYARMCIHTMYILHGWVFTKGHATAAFGGLIKCVNLTTTRAPPSCEQFPFIFIALSSSIL